MSVLLFFLILSVLVIVHELGHFLAARYFGIRVDEFGLGYPPRAKELFTWKGTLFTLNWLPFGGFVKIYGEDYDSEEKDESSFQHKNRGIQATVLAAGVFFNLIFAWFLISLGLVSGLPAPVGLAFAVDNPQTVITAVIPGSPAADAGLRGGDAIISINNAPLSPEEASMVIAKAEGPLDFTIERGKTVSHKTVTPEDGIIEGQKAIGIAMELIGTAKLSPWQAFKEGAKITWELERATASALGSFLRQAVVGKANLSSVTGPIGLVGMVGDAQELGLGYLLSFTALISLNLSIINLLPFPALDGGRLLFVALEAIFRRRIPAKVFNVINTAGFGLLILLMILVTFHDLRAIF